MTALPYTLDPDDPAAPPMGLIVLQSDETIEPEFHRYFSAGPGPLYVTRIPSGEEVTHETLGRMEQDLTAAAALFPRGLHLPVVGYGCTSASSIIGSDKVEALVRSACDAGVVTNPLRAAVACAAAQGLSRLALVSPYIEEVNAPLRRAFADHGIDMPVSGSFGIPTEAQVVRISARSVIDAALELGRDPSVQGVFLSCTNLRTIDVIPEIEARLGKPVLSSNQSLAWHMKTLQSGSRSKIAEQGI